MVSGRGGTELVCNSKCGQEATASVIDSRRGKEFPRRLYLYGSRCADWSILRW